LDSSLSPESIRKSSRIACDYSDSPQGCGQVTDRDSRGVNLEHIPGFLRKYRSILSRTTRRENYMFLAALLLDNDLPLNASPVRHLTGRWNGKDRRTRFNRSPGTSLPTFGSTPPGSAGDHPKMSFERIVTDEAAMVSVDRVGFLLLLEAQQEVKGTRMNFLHEAGNTTGDAGSSGRNGSSRKDHLQTPLSGVRTWSLPGTRAQSKRTTYKSEALLCMS
jgi:hypothetical protein